MAAQNTIGNLSAMFKEVYSPTLKWLMPKGLRIQNLVEYGSADTSPGGLYHQPVVLKHEHGFTYQAPRVDAFDINGAITGATGDATIEGNQIVLESFLGYEAAARASSAGKRAFMQATQYIVENMWQSARKRLEIDLMYGRTGLGTITAAVASNAVTITTAEFAPGVWAGMEGACVEILNAALSTSRGYGFIKSVDIAARTVTFESTAAPIAHTFSGTAAGDVIFFAAINNAQTTMISSAITAGPTHRSMIGLHTIASTSTGTLFGIDTANSLWKPTTVSAGSANLSFETVMRAISAAVGKGLDEELTLIINPLTFTTLLTDQAALVRHGDKAGGGKYELGAEGITFYSMVGKITILASIYCKEGYGYLVAPSMFKRIGSTDLTFRLPDRGDEFFYQHPTKTAYGLRCYTSQALFTEAPGKIVMINNIDNS